MAHDAVRDRCRGALVGLAVGDALGMPAEEMTPSAIRLEWGTIEGFERAPEGRPCAHLQPGQWTDDTQLAVLLAESLAACEGFDADDFGRRLATWFADNRRPGGWRYPGTAVLEAAGRLAEGMPVRESGVDGAGCGAAMRVAPVGAAFRNRPGDVGAIAAAQSRVTHVNDMAVSGAVAVATAVARLCAEGPGDDGGVAIALDAHEAFLRRPDVAMSGAEIRRHAGDPLAARYAPRGPSGWTAHAVPAALHALASNPGDYRGAVLDAANAGGDTDSVGAIVGALAGAALGWSAIPEAWRDTVEEAERLVAVADELFELGARW